MSDLDHLRTDREALLNELRLAGANIPPGSNGRSFCCPFHNDTHPSAGIYQAEHSVWRCKCHGCGFCGDIFDVRAKRTGRTLAEVLRERDHNSTASAQQDTRPKQTYKTLPEAIKDYERITRGCHVATYEYRTREGDLVAAVARYNFPAEDDSTKPHKTCRPFHPAAGGWQCADPPAGFPLYRLDKLILDGSRRIDLFEGEKCAEAVAELGLNAATTAHGADGISTTDLTPLAGRTVCLWPDNDSAGEAWVRKLAAALTGMGCKVHICPIPGLPEGGGDIADMLDVDGAWHCKDPDECLELVEALAAEAEAWPPLDAPESTRLGLRVINMSDIEPERVEWLWPNRIPLAKVTIFAGDPGKSKSTVSIDIAGRVSTGCGWPDDPGVTYEPGGVLLITAEDGAADTIRPRLDAAGADVSRIRLVEGAVDTPPFDPAREDQPDPEVRPFDIARDIAELEQAIAETPNCRLVILDPISAFLGEKTDSHRDADVRRLLHPLVMLAERTGVAIVAIMHFRKSPGKGVHSVQGSIAFTAQARAVWGITEDIDSPESGRFMLPIKMNLVPDTSGLGYQIVGTENGHPKIEWYAEPVEMTFDEAQAIAERRRAKAQQKKHGPEPEALNEAVAWLTDALSEGPRKVKEIEAEAREAGIADGTLTRARKIIKAVSKPGAERAYWLRLPEQVEQVSPEHEQPAPPAPPDLYSESELAPPVPKNGTDDGKNKGGSGSAS